MPVINIIAAMQEEMTEWRRELHTHPETAFEEIWTSGFVAEKLESFGIEVHRGLAGTGIIGILHGQGESDRMIGLRADMDALPMQEETGLPYASTIDGKMHACGHDGHTSMLLGAAKYLAETRNFSGRVAFIFQPAEEGGGGGRVMLEDGMLERFPMQTVWGMHNWPGMEVGKAGVHRAASMAAADSFTITIKGGGGHGGMPHTTVDPVVAAAALVQALQTIITRRIDALEPVVISVTQIHTGSTHNVIPDEAVLNGTVRYISTARGAMLQQAMAKMAEQMAAAHDCTAEMDWQPGYPPTVNHEAEAVRAAAVVEEVLGSGAADLDLPPAMVSEDFSYMLEARPGAYIWLGAGEGGAGRMLHNTGYDFNDALLPLGASYWARLVETELPR